MCESGHQRATQGQPASLRHWLPSNCDAVGSQFAPSSRPPRLFLAEQTVAEGVASGIPKLPLLNRENLKWSRDPKSSATLASRGLGYCTLLLRMPGIKKTFSISFYSPTATGDTLISLTAKAKPPRPSPLPHNLPSKQRLD